MRQRVLVTGAGGIAGVNFVRAAKASRRGYYVAGSDNSKYYIEFPDLDARYLTPRHDHKDFISRVGAIATREEVDFIHPQPSSEALVISSARKSLPAPVLLPDAEVLGIAQDKLKSQRVLDRKGVPVARTKTVTATSELRRVFGDLGSPLWLRARRGAGGRLSLLCKDAFEASDWVDLWTRRGSKIDEFLVQEYLPGRNIAWDSIWHEGNLVTSYCRERIEYPFKHIAPSGITGTPSVARTVRDKRINSAAERAVNAIDGRPSGAYSVDIKEDASGKPRVTEVDAGKFHTTMPLWGFAAVRNLKLPWYANLADLYLRLGLGEKVERGIPAYDLFPAGYYMIRNMDSGVILWREDGWKARVL